MAFASFQEYMDHKKKVKNKPSIEQVPDYHGPQDTKPDKEKKHKDAGGKGQVGTASGYKSSTSPVDPNKGGKDKGGKGFADEGDKALKYEPGDGWFGGKNGVSKSEGGVPGGKSIAGWTKTKTQEWVDGNKGTSLSEFTKRLKSELKESDCDKNAYSTVRNVVELCQCNKKHVESLVREMKRNNLLSSLVTEMFRHQEVVAEARKLSEKLAAPMHDDEEDLHNDIDGEMDVPDDMGGEDMGDGSDMDISSDDDMDHEDMGDDMGDEDEMGGDDMGGDDMGDEMGMGGDDMGSALGGPEGGGMGDDMPMLKPKKKKKHPHAAHALSAMQGPPAPMDAPMMMKKKMKKG